jgi:pyroglutamyl-peptidase
MAIGPRAKTKVLVSGFEPFGGDTINPTAMIVERIESLLAGSHADRLSDPLESSRWSFDDIELRAVVLPVSYRRAFPRLEVVLDEFSPDVVLALGQAAGRSALEFEQVAINMADAEAKDNDGLQWSRRALQNDGRDAYFSSLPIDEIVAHLKTLNVFSRVSYSAGTFVCNALFFELQQWREMQEVDVFSRSLLRVQAEVPRLTGFMHVPLIAEQLKSGLYAPTTPTLDFATIERGVFGAIEAIELRRKSMQLDLNSRVFSEV